MLGLSRRAAGSPMGSATVLLAHGLSVTATLSCTLSASVGEEAFSGGGNAPLAVLGESPTAGTPESNAANPGGTTSDATNAGAGESMTVGNARAVGTTLGKDGDRSSDTAVMPADAGVPGDAGTPTLPFDVVEPFVLVNGSISAASNPFGLSGSYYVIHNTQITTISITDLSHQICVEGTIAARTPADWAFSLGFILDPEHGPRTGGAIIIGPDDQVPWDMADGRVVGISARFSGPLIPRHLGFNAVPGGMNPNEVDAQFSDCSVRAPLGGPGEVVLERTFAELHTYCWDTFDPQHSNWNSDSTIMFGWSALTDEAPNPFAFCLGDLRPILGEASPNDPE